LRRQPRILMVTPRYLPQIGGVELHVYEVARRLADAGAHVAILTTDPARALPAVERVAGVQVRRVRAWPASRDYYFAPRIYSEITRGTWDVVHVQSFHTLVGPLAMLAALRARIPYVVTFHAGGHSSRLRNALRPAQLSLLRPLLARAERLVALAPFEIDRYSRLLRVPAARFVLIPNGTNLPQAVTIREIRRDDALVASVGRLERYKGHHRMIAALPYLLQRRPEARLWVAGNGPYEADLRRLAAKLGVSNSVEIRAIPIGDRERMARELAQVKVVVSLSEFETQPIATLEALALGCRAVVADVPGLRPLAEEGLARAVPLRSLPADVAAAVLTELEQPEVAQRPTLPTWDDCASGLLELYRSVGDGKGAVAAPGRRRRS
jgi:glycosyltransferase involved in cell wall biosynthesis